jgi:hypothetical protein
MERERARRWLDIDNEGRTYHSPHWPCTIVRDRYSGSYSGALWLAFPLEEQPGGVSGGDGACDEFWRTYDEPVGKGRTPEDALKDLEVEMREIATDGNGNG